jgi:hypothetical protein
MDNLRGVQLRRFIRHQTDGTSGFTDSFLDGQSGGFQLLQADIKADNTQAQQHFALRQALAVAWRHINQEFFNRPPVDSIKRGEHFAEFHAAAEPVKGQQTGVNVNNYGLLAHRAQFVSAIKALQLSQS